MSKDRFTIITLFSYREGEEKSLSLKGDIDFHRNFLDEWFGSNKNIYLLPKDDTGKITFLCPFAVLKDDPSFRVPVKPRIEKGEVKYSFDKELADILKFRKEKLFVEWEILLFEEVGENAEEYLLSMSHQYLQGDLRFNPKTNSNPNKVKKNELVKVYRNLNTGKWSVQAKTSKGWRVADHCNYVVIKGPIEFKVSQAGRNRVLKEKRKNVHAMVVGQMVSCTDSKKSFKGEEISYDPYRRPNSPASFFVTKTGKNAKASDYSQIFFDIKTGRIYGKKGTRSNPDITWTKRYTDSEHHIIVLGDLLAIKRSGQGRFIIYNYNVESDSYNQLKDADKNNIRAFDSVDEAKKWIEKHYKGHYMSGLGKKDWKENPTPAPNAKWYLKFGEVIGMDFLKFFQYYEQSEEYQKTEDAFYRAVFNISEGMRHKVWIRKNKEKIKSAYAQNKAPLKMNPRK